MGIALKCSALLTVFVATPALSLASGTCGQRSSDSDTYPSMISWSSNCFVGSNPRYVVVVQRLEHGDGTVVYANGFRGNHGVSLIGTFSNRNPDVYNAALDIIRLEQAESIRLRPLYTYVDGCASYLAVTRCGATLVISELQMDYSDPQYRKLDSILDRLTNAVVKFDWTKDSGDTLVRPVMLLLTSPTLGPP